MKRWNPCLWIPFLGILPLQVYTWNPLEPPNTYRSPRNPHYWKNRPPYPGYWQQDVYYRIEAELHTDSHVIVGTLWLRYWNNSPDTLHFVFFHLYQNAFQPGSYYDAYVRANRWKPRYGPHERQKKGTIISRVHHEGRTVPYTIWNTLMRVDLHRPLYPGDSTEFQIHFRTYFDERGSLRRRMKMFSVPVQTPDGDSVFWMKHYDGVHWYPRMDVYDRRAGWTLDQHLDKEFYGDFGTFEVKLTLPACYIVEATGNLLNRDEVLPDTFFSRLLLRHYVERPWGSPGTLLRSCNQKLTWHFYAENVHDFAFTADPTYRIDTASWNGIQCIALVQEGHASGWQTVARFTCDVLRIYSRDFGPYIWHKIVVADARDGMEYPMITLCGGREPGNYGLIAHEVGHMWFFGMVGNNETYRAFLDEGFTQFLTAWALEHLGYEWFGAGKGWIRKFRDPIHIRELRVFLGYIRDAQRMRDMPLATHSSDFHSFPRHGGGYRHVYYKTASMLYHLRMVLGDSLFQKVIQTYFQRWYLCHPYEEDFRTTVIQEADVDLNRLLDIYFYTIQRFDYRVQRFRVRSLPGMSCPDSPTRAYQVHAVLLRRDKGFSPLRLEIQGKNLVTLRKYFLPVDWNMEHLREQDEILLPVWYGWGEKFHRRYELVDTLCSEERPRRLILDPSFQMPDIYLPDNARPRLRKVFLNVGVAHLPQWKYRLWLIRPALWWNPVDRLMAGIAFQTHYMNYRHTVYGWFWLHRAGPIPPLPVPADFSGILLYSTWKERWLPEARLGISLYRLFGRAEAEGWFQFRLRHTYTLDVHRMFLAIRWVHWADALRYAPDPSFLRDVAGEHHLLFSGGWAGRWKWRSRTFSPLQSWVGISSALYRSSRQQPLFGWMETILFQPWQWRFLTGGIRLLGWFSFVPGSVPKVYQPGVAGASLDRIWRDPIWGALAFIPPLNGATRPGQATWYLPTERGGNLRTVAGILPAGDILTTFTADVGIRIPRSPRKISLRLYLFGEAGLWQISDPSTPQPSPPPDHLIASGTGMELFIRQLGKLSGIHPIRVRVDVPLVMTGTLTDTRIPRPIFSVISTLWLPRVRPYPAWNP